MLALTNPLIDIGVNLTDKAFADDREAVIARAHEAGVARMILTGTSASGSRAAQALAARYPDAMFSTAGVHPHDASNFGSETIGELRELAGNPNVVAIGECGLDFNRDFSPRPAQRDAFREQIELACELNMPLFVHERDAAGDLLTILDAEGGENLKVVVHCFTGSEDTLDEYLKRDFFIGVTGWICDERRGLHLRDIVGKIAPQRLMLETDAPYLLPRTIRPKPKSRRNEPAYLPYVADAVAESLEIEIEKVAARTTRAAESFFGITPADSP